MIRNIIFDMGNVLLDYDPNVCLDLYLKADEDKELFLRELFGGPEWVQLDLGTITREEVFETLCTRVPERLRVPLRQCLYNWQVCMKPLPGAETFLHALKTAGYCIFILSNASQLFYDYFPGFMPLAFFDGIVISSDVHVVKPDEKIYRHLLDTYRLKPEESLFIDDRADNVTGAERLGINAFQFTGSFQDIDKAYHLLSEE